MIIFNSGNGRVGKDSMTEGFIRFLTKKGILAKRYAFADELKNKLDPLLFSNHGVSAFTEDAVEKPLIRPMLLAYGQMCRKIDKDYWVKTVEQKIQDDKTPHLAIVSDCRYPSEFNYFCGEKFLLHITRYDELGNEYPPIGTDEEINNPILKDMADFKFSWENCSDNKEILYYKGEQLMNSLFEHKLSEWQTIFPL
jgi:hypothetical protein